MHPTNKLQSIQDGLTRNKDNKDNNKAISKASSFIFIKTDVTIQSIQQGKGTRTKYPEMASQGKKFQHSRANGSPTWHNKLSLISQT